MNRIVASIVKKNLDGRVPSVNLDALEEADRN